MTSIARRNTDREYGCLRYDHFAARICYTGNGLGESWAKQETETLRQRSTFSQTINGATTTITLAQSPTGWEVKGWTYQIGDVKTYAEGDPYLHETFADYDEAASKFKDSCVVAVEHPEAQRPQPTTMVDITTQEVLDAAARDDRGSLDDVFNELRGN